MRKILIALCFCGVARAEGPNRASLVLTPAIAQQVLGAPAQASPHNKMADTMTGPIWVSNANYSLSGGRSVSLLIRHAASKDEASSIFASSKVSFKGVDVHGLGVPAYRTTTPAQLNVLKGANWLIISVGTFKKPEEAGQLKAAKAILPGVKE